MNSALPRSWGGPALNANHGDVTPSIPHAPRAIRPAMERLRAKRSSGKTPSPLNFGYIGSPPRFPQPAKSAPDQQHSPRTRAPLGPPAPLQRRLLLCRPVLTPSITPAVVAKLTLFPCPAHQFVGKHRADVYDAGYVEMSRRAISWPSASGPTNTFRPESVTNAPPPGTLSLFSLMDEPVHPTSTPDLNAEKSPGLRVRAPVSSPEHCLLLIFPPQSNSLSEAGMCFRAWRG